MKLRHDPNLPGRRVLVTGAVRGIGAAVAQRLHEEDAQVALAGLEPDLPAQTARRCGNGPWRTLDVSDRSRVETVVDELTQELGGLDVVVANAGVAAQSPVVEGDVHVFEQTADVNLLGTYYTVRAAGRHLRHPPGRTPCSCRRWLRRSTSR